MMIELIIFIWILLAIQFEFMLDVSCFFCRSLVHPFVFLSFLSLLELVLYLFVFIWDLFLLLFSIFNCCHDFCWNCFWSYYCEKNCYLHENYDYHFNCHFNFHCYFHNNLTSKINFIDICPHNFYSLFQFCCNEQDNFQ